MIHKRQKYRLDGQTVILTPATTHIAQDSDGEWYGYCYRPRAEEREWIAYCTGYLCMGKPRKDWRAECWAVTDTDWKEN